MSRLLPLLLGLSLALPPAEATEDSTAPLGQSRQQLKELQAASSKAQPGSENTANSLKGIAPSLATPAEPVFAPSAAPAADIDSKAGKSSGQNWLLDGYVLAGGKTSLSRQNTAPTRGTPDRPETDAIDPKDPQYILKVYALQSANQTRNGTDSAGDKHFRLGDAMAPYLNDWLARSPMRELILEGMSKDNSNQPGGTGSGYAAYEYQPTANQSSAGNIYSAKAANEPEIQVNPYLSALSAPETTKSSNQPVSAAMPPQPTKINQSPNNAIEGKLPNSRSQNYKAPITPADEDKKYFPQLKRF